MTQYADSLFDRVVGQPEAVARLRAAAANPVHAYLFLGPHGSGKLLAARAFAAAVLTHGRTARDPDDPGAGRDAHLALQGRHPDVFEFEPEGRTLRGEEAARLIVEGSRSPIEGNRKVVVCNRFHAAEPGAAASLLKTIEEPPESVIFVLLSEEVPREHVTIASRCTTVEFRWVPEADIRDHLVGRGVGVDAAAEIASAARGDVDRAELLADDPGLSHRRGLWLTAVERLDGTGAAVGSLVSELREAIDAALEPLESRQRAEIDELARREEQLGTRGSGRAEIEARHRREKRRVRDAELRFGLAILADGFRQGLTGPHQAEVNRALAELRHANDALVRNPNEALLLERLFLRLPRSVPTA